MNPPNEITVSNIEHSYMILAPNEMKAEPDERKAGKVCLETIKLDPDWYRIGHTKARNLRPPWYPFFRKKKKNIFTK